VGDASSSSRLLLNVVGGCVVATAPADLDRETLDRMRQDLLDRVRASGARRILLDLSAVHLMDTEDFRAVVRLVAAARLMGARTVLAGLQPGVVAALVELGAQVGDIEAVLDLDHGFARFDEDPAAAPDEGNGEEQAG
jgi:anti-anti-sigma regulatory factor